MKNFVLAVEDFTTENGMLTPTLKLKRRAVLERYGADLDGALLSAARVVPPRRARHNRPVTPVEKADVLLEALPYIRRFAGKVLVIKYGGHAMERDELKDAFAQDVALLKYVGMHPVIVHGGGPQIDAALRQAGIEPRFVRGMRVTDAATMDDRREGARRQDQRGDRRAARTATARAPSGSRARTASWSWRASARGTVDLGLVGDVVGVNPRVIEALQGFIPVIAPTAADADGQTYNINADVVAGKIAEALRAEKLILLTDVEGVKGRDGTLIDTLSADEARDLIARRHRSPAA